MRALSVTRSGRGRACRACAPARGVRPGTGPERVRVGAVGAGRPRAGQPTARAGGMSGDRGVPIAHRRSGAVSAEYRAWTANETVMAGLTQEAAPGPDPPARRPGGAGRREARHAGHAARESSADGRTNHPDRPADDDDRQAPRAPARLAEGSRRGGTRRKRCWPGGAGWRSRSTRPDRRRRRPVGRARRSRARSASGEHALRPANATVYIGELAVADRACRRSGRAPIAAADAWARAAACATSPCYRRLQRRRPAFYADRASPEEVRLTRSARVGVPRRRRLRRIQAACRRNVIPITLQRWSADHRFVRSARPSRHDRAEGLRERKKRLTREAILPPRTILFAERGFERHRRGDRGRGQRLGQDGVQLRQREGRTAVRRPADRSRRRGPGRRGRRLGQTPLVAAARRCSRAVSEAGRARRSGSAMAASGPAARPGSALSGRKRKQAGAVAEAGRPGPSPPNGPPGGSPPRRSWSSSARSPATRWPTSSPRRPTPTPIAARRSASGSATQQAVLARGLQSPAR